MTKFKFTTKPAIALYAMLAVVFLCGCENNNNKKVYTAIKVCKILKAKHSENESTNLTGDFIVVNYFLYEDGTLEKVNLKDYMSFNISDTVCWKVRLD